LLVEAVDRLLLVTVEVAVELADTEQVLEHRAVEQVRNQM
jgi:hypothetical protein